MSRFLPLLTLVVIGALGSASASAASLVWHWEDRFSPAEKRKLQAWVSETRPIQKIGRDPVTSRTNQNSPAGFSRAGARSRP